MPETKAFRKLLGRPFWPLPSDSPKIARQCPPLNALCTLQTFESIAPIVTCCFSWLLVETIAQDPLAGANHLQSCSFEFEHQSSCSIKYSLSSGIHNFLKQRSNNASIHNWSLHIPSFCARHLWICPPSSFVPNPTLSSHYHQAASHQPKLPAVPGTCQACREWLKK